MNEKLEAIKEAITFIQHNWIGDFETWTGDVNDFVGATIKTVVTKIDIKNLIKAINDGEPTTVHGLGGIIVDGEVTSVWVTSCME